MEFLTVSETEFYTNPEHHLREARKKGQSLVVHSNNGCVVTCCLTKLKFEELTKNGHLP